MQCSNASEICSITYHVHRRLGGWVCKWLLSCFFSCSPDLLDLSFDEPVSVPTNKQPSQPSPSQLQHTMQVMSPQISSDISLLDPTPTSTVPKVSEPQGSLALNLLETPLTSLKVPEEYSKFPIAIGWESKVRIMYLYSWTPNTVRNTLKCFVRLSGLISK